MSMTACVCLCVWLTTCRDTHCSSATALSHRALSTLQCRASTTHAHTHTHTQLNRAVYTLLARHTLRSKTSHHKEGERDREQCAVSPLHRYCGMLVCGFVEGAKSRTFPQAVRQRCSSLAGIQRLWSSHRALRPVNLTHLQGHCQGHRLPMRVLNPALAVLPEAVPAQMRSHPVRPAAGCPRARQRALRALWLGQSRLGRGR